ncbi:hypothetical protein CGRA01v4_09534 [Colletotrichum graminicola]|nr:hypothetical protein CGRA01v4_09534 [Colletotrichum graminicola]
MMYCRMRQVHAVQDHYWPRPLSVPSRPSVFSQARRVTGLLSGLERAQAFANRFWPNQKTLVLSMRVMKVHARIGIRLGIKVW